MCCPVLCNLLPVQHSVKSCKFCGGFSGRIWEVVPAALSLWKVTIRTSGVLFWRFFPAKLGGVSLHRL